jgi:5-methylcytosine-specific restriction endonuclease McrA
MALRDAVYGATWRKVRLAVLERYGYLCQIRGEGCRLVADQVDHVVAVVQGGSAFDPENLRASCALRNARRGGVLGASRAARFSERRPSREW